MEPAKRKFVNTLPRGGEETCSSVVSEEVFVETDESDSAFSDYQDNATVLMGDRELIPGFPDITKDTNVRLVARKILHTSPYPTLLFALRRDSGSISFFDMKETGGIRSVYALASELFGDYAYNGYYRDGDDVYAVVTCDASFLSCDASVTWHVGSELVNQKHCFGVPFSQTVVEFFSGNPVFLHQQQGSAILPTPSVWYLPSNGDDLISLRCRGPERHDVDSDVGPFYRLFSFSKASSMKGYNFIIRYAVFENDLVCDDQTDAEWWRSGGQLVSRDGHTLTLVKSDDVHFIEYNDHYSSDSSPAGVPNTSL